MGQTNRNSKNGCATRLNYKKVKYPQTLLLKVHYETSVPTVEDRLVQRAVARIVEAVFEADFLDCSYGFRPRRSPHHALRTLRATLVTKKVRHLYEADIRGYFTHINHQWLMRMLAQRIADGVILRLIGKW